jgi:hypothetical protein
MVKTFKNIIHIKVLWKYNFCGSGWYIYKLSLKWFHNVSDGIVMNELFAHNVFVLIKSREKSFWCKEIAFTTFLGNRHPYNI